MMGFLLYEITINSCLLNENFIVLSAEHYWPAVSYRRLNKNDTAVAVALHAFRIYSNKFKRFQ